MLRIFNPDGSEAELSGNGARQAALYIHSHGWAGDEFATAHRVRPDRAADHLAAHLHDGDRPRGNDFRATTPPAPTDGRGTLDAAGREWAFQHVSIGNPQCAIEVARGLEDLDLAEIGPEIERHELFPNRTNVSFYRVDDDRVRARIFERGVGETLSSGHRARAVPPSRPTSPAHPASSRSHSMEASSRSRSPTSSTSTLSGWAEPICTAELSEELLAALERA